MSWADALMVPSTSKPYGLMPKPYGLMPKFNLYHNSNTAAVLLPKASLPQLTATRPTPSNLLAMRAGINAASYLADKATLR
jgi:hypothetical protein